MIDSLPMFIHQFGQSCHPMIKEILISENIDIECFQKLAKISGKILCAMSRKTFVKKETLHCKICNGTQTFSSDLNGLNEFIMELFQRFIGHENNQVKRNAVIYLLDPMANHGFINQG